MFFWTANQHNRMFSEGSCDTEDRSNDAENSALHHRNTLHFKIKLKADILNWKNIPQCCFTLVKLLQTWYLKINKYKIVTAQTLVYNI